MSIKKKGQSTLEYIILVTAVVVVILGYVGSTTGGFQGTLNDTLKNATKKMPEVMGGWETPEIN